MEAVNDQLLERHVVPAQVGSASDHALKVHDSGATDTNANHWRLGAVQQVVQQDVNRIDCGLTHSPVNLNLAALQHGAVQVRHYATENCVVGQVQPHDGETLTIDVE